MTLTNSKPIAQKVKQFMLMAVPIGNNAALPYTSMMFCMAYVVFTGITPSVSQLLHEEVRAHIIVPI